MKYISVGLHCFLLIGVLAVITSAFRVDVTREMLVPESEAEGQDNVGIREKRETEDVETQARIVGFRQSEKEGNSAQCRGRKRRRGNGGNGGNGGGTDGEGGGNGGNGGNGEATTMASTPAEAERLRRRNG